MKTLEQIANEIALLKSALIFCHVRPDGDTLGSGVALYLGLKQKGIDCKLVCDGEIADKYRFMPSTSEVLRPEEVKFSAEGHIAVDIPGEHMLGHCWGIYTASQKTFCIDHHPSNSRFTKNLYLETKPANTINIYHVLEAMNVSITRDIAEAILLGIITDTGVFMHNSTSGEALTIAGKMVGLGADFHKIIFNVFKNQSRERSQLYIEVMNKMRFYLDNRLAIITIKKDQLATYQLNEEATEGFVDYPLTISGVKVSVSLLQTKNELYRVSFRSNGEVNVNNVASEFGGGGHVFASGCVVAGVYEEVIEKIIRAVDINLY